MSARHDRVVLNAEQVETLFQCLVEMHRLLAADDIQVDELAVIDEIKIVAAMIGKSLPVAP